MPSGYDIYQQTLSKLKSPYGPNYESLYGPRSLTPVQQEIQTYAEQIKAEEKPKIRPLQWIFDRLQTGQYVSANMVDQAMTNTKKDDPLLQEIGEVLKAGWQGITGERKGSYKDILTEQLGMADRPGKIDLSDVLGFAGDVLLDPLTYIALPVSLTAGASKMGVQAATKWSDDVARVFMKNLGKNMADASKDDVFKFMSKGFDITEYRKLIDKTPEKAIKYFNRNIGGDTARLVNEVKNKAYKEALQTPAAELRDKMISETRGLMEEASAKKAEAMSGFVFGDVAPGQIQTLTQPASWIEDLVSAIPTAYGGAGERVTGRFLGKELGRQVRPLNSIERMREALGSAIGTGAEKVGLKKAWWNAMNTGPIGAVRRLIGIKNPYQKLVNLEYMEQGVHFGNAQLTDEMGQVMQAIGLEDTDDMPKLVQLVMRAEEKSTKENPLSIFDILDDATERAQIGIVDEEIVGIQELGRNVLDLTRKFRSDYMKIAQEGIMPDNMGEIKNYLPLIFKDSNIKTSKYFADVGSARPGFIKKRKLTLAENAQEAATQMQFMTGMTKQEALTAVQNLNLSDLNMDLRSMLNARAYAMANIKKRANIVRTFKEFGVPLEDVQGAMGPSINVGKLGLVDSEVMGLEGLLFDREVIDVIERVTKATSHKNITWLQKAFNWYNSWFKGMATMTTGFHARNNLSNQVTGWMVHGTDWFEPKKSWDGMVAAIYTGKKSNIKNALKDIGMSEGKFKGRLNAKYGDYTLGQLADMQMKTGLLTEAQMGIDPASAYEQVTKGAPNVNPFSRRFIGREASQKLGGVVENSAKMHSFLIDYDKLYRQAGELGEGVAQASQEQALKYAERNAKKWWIDYADLTEFEQKAMKKIIPFYTWMRKNIGNQLEGMLLYPQTFSMFPKIQDAMTFEDPSFDPELIPDWMKDVGMFPTALDAGGRRMLFRPDMPFMDVNKMLPFTFEEEGIRSWIPKFEGKEFFDEIINSSNPIVKQVMSFATGKGYDFFRQRDLKDDAPAPLFLRFLNKNVDVLEKIDGMLRWTGVKGYKPKIDSNGKLVMNAQYLQFLENNLPIIRNIDSIMETAMNLETLQEGMEDASLLEGDQEKIDAVFRTLGTIAGIKFYAFDEEKAAEDRAGEILSEARQRRTEARKGTPEQIQGSTDYWQREKDLIRRMGI